MPFSDVFPDFIPGQDKTRRAKIVLPISLWKATYFQREHLQVIKNALIKLNADLIAAGYAGIEVEFVLTGVLQRHMYVLEGKSEQEALKAAKDSEYIWLHGGKVGDSLAPKHQDILDELKELFPCTIKKWDGYISTSSKYQDYDGVVEEFYKKNIEVKTKIDRVALMILQAYQAQNSQSQKSKEEKNKLDCGQGFIPCRDYILEELKVMLMWKATGYADYMFYPISSNRVLNAEIIEAFKSLVDNVDQENKLIFNDKTIKALAISNINFSKELKNKKGSPVKGRHDANKETPADKVNIEVALGVLNSKANTLKKRLELMRGPDSKERLVLYNDKLPSHEESLRQEIFKRPPIASFAERRNSPPKDVFSNSPTVILVSARKVEVDISHVNPEWISGFLQDKIDDFIKLVEQIIKVSKERDLDEINSITTSVVNATKELEGLISANLTSAKNFDSSPSPSPSNSPSRHSGSVPLTKSISGSAVPSSSQASAAESVRRTPSPTF